MIRDLNPVIRGWSTYYRHVSASRAFAKVRHRRWQMLWKWAKRRHPKKHASPRVKGLTAGWDDNHMAQILTGEELEVR